MNGCLLVWSKFFSLIVDLFGFNIKMPLRVVMRSFFFLLMGFCCYYGHLSWNISWGRIFEFSFCWALIAWFVTFIILLSEELVTNVFGLHGEGYKGVLYAIWGKMRTVFVRPFSLSLRLTINLLVGHFFMMSWIYSMERVSRSFLFSFFKTHLGLFFVVLFEFCVFVLQSFIFSRLLSIYLEEA